MSEQALSEQGWGERRGNAEMLADTVALAGLTAIDVGCGDGSLCRLMARRGALVTGFDPSPGQVARARAVAAAAGETYAVAGAQALPCADAAIDLVVFFNSLHHVPLELQGEALREAARVLKPGGLAYVSEPLAEGPLFQVVRLVDDETAVRAAAYDRLREVERFGLSPWREIRHVNTVRHADYQAFRKMVVAIDESRARAAAARDPALRQAFESHGRQSPEGWLFDQPMRVNLLRKPA